MARALLTALSALRAHQSWLDVIGDNLANTNTPGYKSSRALFSDLFQHTLQNAAPPTGNIGGRNPSQIGQGVRLGHVDKNLAQGALQLTGRTFDVALSGRGLFALNDGVRDLFTRVGNFGLDVAHDLVDLRTGYRVLGPAGQPVNVDVDAVFPPQATSNVGFKGNLPAKVTGPLAEELSSSSPFAEGTAAQLTGSQSEPFAIPTGETWTFDLVADGGAPQTVSVTSATGSVSAAEVAQAIDALDHVSAAVGTSGEVVVTTDKSGAAASLKIVPGEAGQDLAGALGLATSLVSGTETAATESSDLSALTTNQADYANGDTIEVSGTDADGTPVAATFTYGVDGTTVADLVAFLDSTFQGASVAFDASTQQIDVVADATGESQLSLVVEDGQSQTGKTSWGAHAFAVTTNGAGPDTVTTSAEVFDAAGTSHVLTVEYVRQDDGSWQATASIPEDEGTVTSGTIASITFDSNGALLSPPSATIAVQFDGQPAQSIALALGTPGDFDGLTQFGGSAAAIVNEQDGYGAGELGSLVVNDDGTIEGFYTNGQSQALAQLGVATFANERGLEHIGDNYFVQSTNSGTPILGAGDLGPAGEVVGGALEQSNVDTAEEFVRLIEAQRGFQANARVVTAQNDLLSEVVNLI